MHEILAFLGHPMAVCMSMRRENSAPVVLLHGLMGWFYLFYVGFHLKFVDGYREFKDNN